MRTCTRALAALSLACLGCATPATAAATTDPLLPVLALPFEHVYHFAQDSPAHGGLRRRATANANTLQLNVGGPQVTFTVNATLGTPPQPVTFILDTGSADLVAITKQSDFCSQNAGACGDAGYYNPNKSSTYKYVSSNWTGNYGLSDVDASQSGGTGDFATEKLGFGGATLNSIFMAIAYKGDLSQSILGLAYPGLENTVGGRVPIQGNYSNFPQLLANQGIINQPAFSVWSDSIDGYTGTILFGGSDTKKYNGTLKAIDIQRAKNVPYYADLAITLNSLTLKGLESSSSKAKRGTRKLLVKKAVAPIVATVDTGSGGCRVSTEMANPIIKALGGKYNATVNAVEVDCKYLKSKATIDFAFPGVTMTVPLRSFLGLYGTNYCLLGLTGGGENDNGSGDGSSLIGVNFLKSVYAVFDLDKNQISFAPRDFASTESNIVALGTPRNPSKKNSGVKSHPTLNLPQIAGVVLSVLVASALL